MVDPLVISEKWIRERLNLTIDTLEDVRSLALPGSYHEKIAHLGRSLASFTRLKHLDLSRNAIHSLEGLEHLRLLETLNLYYNNIPDLQELYRLRHNSNLKELDLRLNPVTKNEPDYRLFIIHMLVKIRLLDDRPVKDSERKAALMHFDSSQAAELRHQEINSQMHDGNQQDSVPKHIQSRKELVNSLARPPVHIGSDETDQLLDLIAENEERLAPGRVCNSSGKKKQDGLRHQQRQYSTPKAMATKPSARMHSKSPDKHSAKSTPHYRQHSSTTGGTIRTPRSTPMTDHVMPRSMTHHVGGAVSPSGVTISDEIRLRELFSILKGKDIVHWESNTALQLRLVEWLSQRSGGRERRASHDEHVTGEVTALAAKLEQKEAELHKVSEKLKEREMEAIVLGQKLQLQAEELAQLQLKQQQNNDPTATELLQQAQADLSTLNEHVRNLQKENSSLRVQLSQNSGSPLDTQLLDRLQTENKLLRAEADSLSQQNRQQQQGLSQVEELATMLQESHRSLVATNDHLLKELEEAKRRHKLELQQSHSNYEQLRQTVNLIQET